MTKVCIVWAAKVQRSYLSWHWGVMQILKKNWPVVWKKTWEIWHISTRAFESAKIGTLISHQIGAFVQSRKGITLKLTEELCVMTMKNKAKFEEELTFHFKADMKWKPTLRNLKQVIFNLLFKCPRKLSRSVVFFNVQYIYF